MGASKYINALFRKKQCDSMVYLNRLRVWEFRQQPAIRRCTGPSNPEKARRLGYKAKQGYCIFRVRVVRGGRKRDLHKGIVHGKPVNQGIHLTAKQNLRAVAEGRAGRRATNMRVLNSYQVTKDGSHKWFEVIMVDPNHAAVRKDPRTSWIAKGKHARRECRGMTSAGRKHRGLGKGHLHNNKGPSVHANWVRHNTTSLRRYR